MFCDNKCEFLNKKEDLCTKFGNQILPRNIYNKLFKCSECVKEKNENESKDTIRHNN